VTERATRLVPADLSLGASGDGDWYDVRVAPAGRCRADRGAPSAARNARRRTRRASAV